MGEKRIEHEDGSILIGDIPDSPGGLAFLFTLLIPAALRRKGRGTVLYRQFEREARQKGARHIRTTVSGVSHTDAERRGIRKWLGRQGFWVQGGIRLRYVGKRSSETPAAPPETRMTCTGFPADVYYRPI